MENCYFILLKPIDVILFLILVAPQLIYAQDHAHENLRNDSRIEQVLSYAGNNAKEINQFLSHYRSSKDSLKSRAAHFLVSQINENKFSYEGDLIHKYDTILSLYAGLRKQNIFVGDPPIISDAWSDLQNFEGRLSADMLEKKYDYVSLSASFLIENTDMAFTTWKNAPVFISKKENDFYEYVLPYRVGEERVEDYRRRYYHQYRPLLDSADTPETLLKIFNKEFKHTQQFKSSALLWDYPLDFSISQMELGQRGSCRHLTNYCAQVMRACGLPITIDRAVWANRSVGHAWNVLMLDSNKILPFDDFASEKIEFAYKPAKIFRRKFSQSILPFDAETLSELPQDFIDPYEEDVTDQYGAAYNITVPITRNNSFIAHRRLGVICVFDNNDWRMVHYGTIDSSALHFIKMSAGVAYLAAFYEAGSLIPASEPFMLKENGTVQYCSIYQSKKETMHLTRKYPMFKRIEDFAWGLRRANFETSDNASFEKPVVHFSVYNIPFQIADSLVAMDRPYRYIRFNAASHRNANLAEVEFYGKLDGKGEEVKLEGEIMGFPEITGNDLHPYSSAMDGNLETWYEKSKGAVGWVGLDLGSNNKYRVTRVRFCPRSDTNFILTGDTYELKYWDGNEWKSFGVKVATDQVVSFENVPAGTLYILHNQSRGREERIFTYEDGKQVWW